MKKLLTAIAVLGVASMAFGQGMVNFVNQSPQLVSTNKGGTVGLVGTALNQVSYGLFWAPTGTTDPSLFQFVAYGTNQAVAGRFLGGVGTSGAPSIPDNAAGTSVNILFRGWSSNFGATPVNATRYDSAVWTSVAAAVKTIVPGKFEATGGPSEGWLFGESSIGTVKLGGGAIANPTPFGLNPGQIQTGFTLNFYTVPEPSTLALAGLGAASLLIFRRRK